MKPLDSHPWILTKKYGDPRYFRSLADAKRAMHEELKSLEYSLGVRLNDQESIAAIRHAMAELDRIPDNGCVVDFLVDPRTGIRYKADVRRRQPE